MNSGRFRDCLAALDWSQRGLAAKLRTHPTTVRRWATGDASVPDNVENWLEMLTATHRTHAMPVGWSQSGTPEKSLND